MAELSWVLRRWRDVLPDMGCWAYGAEMMWYSARYVVGLTLLPRMLGVYESDIAGTIKGWKDH